MTAALAEQERQRLRVLEDRLQVLLADHALEEVLTCAVHALSRRRRSPAAP